MTTKYSRNSDSNNVMPTVAINLVLAETKVYSGESVRAQVVIDSADPDTIVHELVAEVRGTGKAGWVNIHTDKIYETEKDYIAATLNLVQQSTPLGQGRHQFSFIADIPKNAPSSYESQFGTIRYTIRISLISNTANATLSELFPFLVVTRAYFDDLPSAIMRQIEYTDEVDFTVCSLPFGTVYLKIIMPRTGYKLGENIPSKVCVKNSTRKALKDCKLQLVLKTQFEAMSRYEHVNEKKLLESVMDTFVLGRIKGRTEKDFEISNLKIPENAVPSQYNRSEADPHIITMSYVVRFTALPGIETEIPLMITSKGYKNIIRHGNEEQPQPQSTIRPPNINRPRHSIVESNVKSRGIAYYC
uniref:Arrestin_C domain-containing protein n=1 Tax=Panagrellus redivivus TaxID=6233 RepID=A0A7E4ZVU3_PANRE